MKQTKLRLLAFPFGDFEAVRTYLDEQAKKGWELTGRAGALFGRFEPTQRTELIYDVVPADPRRSAETLQSQVRCREEAGWTPVDTVWGMDIYKSLPCQAPSLFRNEEDCRQWKAAFQSWLIWSLAFIVVTVLSLLIVCRFSGFTLAGVADGWYRSDQKTALCLLLPLMGMMALLWLVWLSVCVVRRSRVHKAAPRWLLFFRTGLQLTALAAVLLLPILLWVSQVSRLWLRLVLLALFLLLPLLCLWKFSADRKRYIRTLGAGVISLFALTMVLGWAIAPVTYNSYDAGSSWRKTADGLSIVTAEELQAADTPDLGFEGSTVIAFYEREEALLFSAEYYSEHWDSGLSMELATYHPQLPGIADLLWEDLVPNAAEDQGDRAFLSSNGWYQVWYRCNNTVYHLSGTIDWESTQIWPRAIAIAYANGQ